MGYREPTIRERGRIESTYREEKPASVTKNDKHSLDTNVGSRASNNEGVSATSIGFVQFCISNIWES
jgi:hypothetical protein